MKETHSYTIEIDEDNYVELEITDGRREYYIKQDVTGMFIGQEELDTLMAALHKLQRVGEPNDGDNRIK